MNRTIAIVLMFSLVFPFSFVPNTANAASLFSDGFESGNFSNWTSANGVWSAQNGGANSGSKKAEAKGDSGASPDILQKNISTSGQQNVVLKYWYKIAAGLEVSDHIKVEWSVDGVNWNLLADYTNINSTNNYTEATHNIAGATNQSGFRFRFTADINSNGDQVWIDDVSLTADVIPVNTAPIATNVNTSTNEDTPLVVTLTATDPESNPLTYSIVSNPSNGSLGTVSGNQVTYTPNGNYNGADSFTFKANDGALDSNTATVNINVNSINDLPTITSIPDQVVVELVALSLSAVGSDTESTVTYSLSLAQSGMSINPTTGEFTWTPTESQGPGVYSVTVVVSDGTDTASDTFDITVSEANTAPLANPLSISTHQNTAYNGSVTATDTDLPANTLTYSLLSGPVVLGSSAVVNLDGTFTYTPETNYNGLDSFTFEVTDGLLTSSNTVSVNVNNNAPILDTILDYVMDELSNLQITFTAVDDPLDTLTYSFVGLVPSGVTIVGDLFDWTPTESQDGIYNFTVQVSDGALSDSKSFAVTVNEVNEAPVSLDDNIVTDEDLSVNANLNATDADLPANVLTYIIESSPSNGSLTAFDLNTGAYTYTPNANYNGVDSFMFKANDGTTNGNIATVSLTINPVNDAPTITLNGTDPINLVVGDTFLDPGAVGNDLEDGSLTPSVTGTVDVNTPGTYILTYSVTDSDDVSTSTTRNVIVTSAPVENTQPLCSDSLDNDGDSLVDLSDPDCSSFIPPTPPTPPSPQAPQTPVSSPAANGPIYGSIGTSGGQVLGAYSNGQVLGETCGLYMNKHLRMGSSRNDAEQVRKLQEFLNNHLGSNLPVTGYFGNLTLSAVKALQTKYSDEILKPWGLNTPTGLVYLSTLRQINNLECSDIIAMLPELVPWSQNPNAQ